MALAFLALICGLGATGCTSSGPGSAVGADPDPAAGQATEVPAVVDAGMFTFSYVAKGDAGFMDQTLDIHSSAEVPVLLTAEISALDDDGEVQAGLDVTTVFGSDIGRMVVMPGPNLDVVLFDAENGGTTRDLRVEVQEVTPVDGPALTGWVEVVPSDDEGAETQNPDRFTHIALRGDNDLPATVCAVYLVWGDVAPGDSQQAAEVVDLLPPTTAAADSDTFVELPADLRRRLDLGGGRNGGSFKAYYCLPA